jgi:hypothetical protein
MDGRLSCEEEGTRVGSPRGGVAQEISRGAGDAAAAWRKAAGDRRAIGPPGAEQAGRPVHGSAGESGERICRGRAGGGNFLPKGRAVA